MLCFAPLEQKTGPPLHFLADCIQLREEIKAWICFQKIPLGTALSKGWRLTFQSESQEVMRPRATPQGLNLNTLFPHCCRAVIIYYSISSIAHHLVACVMGGLDCFSSTCSDCPYALRRF